MIRDGAIYEKHLVLSHIASCNNYESIHTYVADCSVFGALSDKPAKAHFVTTAHCLTRFTFCYKAHFVAKFLHFLSQRAVRTKIL